MEFDSLISCVWFIYGMESNFFCKFYFGKFFLQIFISSFFLQSFLELFSQIFFIKNIF